MAVMLRHSTLSVSSIPMKMYLQSTRSIGHSASHDGKNVHVKATVLLLKPLYLSRLCPGKHLAENSLFIMIANILAAFDITPPETGDLTPKFTQGLVSYTATPNRLTVASPRDPL
ncbi:hypothetical protein EIP86_010580 [Pleurotus ostreatoroseus]|nr:hypothetical protein EIP86_010580 [Pleurotus ostreatoroseus]